MKPTCIYIGCFVSPEELFQRTDHLREDPLEREIPDPHVTFAFRPKEVDDTLFGSPVEITITGYGNDGWNEGVSVTVSSPNPAIQAMADQIPIPHITLAVGQDGKPVDTADLLFSPVTPIHITGQFGAYMRNGSVRLTPFHS